MEKRTPHCRLSVVKALLEAGKVRTTLSALAGGAALGFDFERIVAVVAALTPTDFYKSMTTVLQDLRIVAHNKPSMPLGSCFTEAGFAFGLHRRPEPSSPQAVTAELAAIEAVKLEWLGFRRRRQPKLRSNHLRFMPL